MIVLVIMGFKFFFFEVIWLWHKEISTLVTIFDEDIVKEIKIDDVDRDGRGDSQWTE